MSRVHAISVVLGVVAGASLALASTLRPRVEPAIELRVARELVAADAGTHWRAVEARAAQIAAMPLLAAAVVTDAVTVRDLTAEELAPVFRIGPREAVELGQVHGERAVSLVRVPDAAAPVPLARTGRWLSVTGDGLRFTSIERIVPIQDADTLRGAVAVSAAAPPDVALARLAARTPGRLVIDGAPVDIAGGIPRGAGTIEVVLDELPGAPRLVLPVAVSTPLLAYGLRALAAAALLAGLGLALSMRARARARVHAGRPRRTSRGMAVVP